PNVMLVIGIRRIRYRITGLIIQSELGDLISARAIVRIAKAWMVRIELHDVIAAGRNFVSSRYRPRVNVVGKKRWCCGIYLSRHCSAPVECGDFHPSAAAALGTPVDAAFPTHLSSQAKAL